MGKSTRRDFFKKSIATFASAGVASTLPASSWSQIMDSNDDIRVAIVGVKKKGQEHIRYFQDVPGVRLVALCDCDTQFLDIEVEKLKRQDKTVDTYIDIRKMLEDKNIDVVVLPIPDHWHALATVWACQAGKDVYVEKPMAWSIWEGRKMVEAARKYNRIVQAGSQERSDIGLIGAAEYLKKGKLGKIKYMHAISYSPRPSIGKVNGPQPIPETCDYNLFQGPALMKPLMRTNLHYDWHWFWETGTGEIGNLGGHVMDDCRWMTGLDKVPPKVISLGGRFGYNPMDDGETPNTQISYYDYTTPVIYEIRGIPQQFSGARTATRAEAQTRKMMQQRYYKGISFGLVIQCENGYYAGGRGGGSVYDNDDNQIERIPGDGGAGHVENFINAVRSRKHTDLKADVLEGHISAAMPFMANVSYRLGRRESPETVKEIIGDNELLQESFGRFMEYMEINNINLDENPITIGPMLTMDSEKEKFIGEYSDLANMFIKRNYREPFSVPEVV